ncbi:MAG: sensor histidine kinase, partial [Acetatifactor sp.]|nr:sensor histidine kinase [Acetatifactor sp.]
EYKEEAWEFLRYIMSKEYPGSVMSMMHLPTRKAWFELWMEAQMAEEDYTNEMGRKIFANRYTADIDGVPYEVAPLTKEHAEQYVDMVLTYLRLGSRETDYVFTHVNLDKLLRECIRKYAGQFIRRHLTLDYRGVDCQVLTDEKWLSFVVEQVLSNALKYTRSGSVSIYLEPPCILCIRDTGIGIAPEDLPRIFEKGYTGYNGRSDKKATGLGLYLCKQICERLMHTITVRSVPGEGTTVCIGLGREVLEVE